MIGAKTMRVGAISYELEVAMDAPIDRVWSALTEDTNAWWLPDFHMVGEGSTVTLDTRAGGGLIEHLDDGGSLLWYTVQWCNPADYVLYLVGHTDLDWGGPATSHLKLKLEHDGDGGCSLRVTDSRHGHVDERNIVSLKEGWTSLYHDGLKRFVEDNVRQDAR